MSVRPDPRTRKCPQMMVLVEERGEAVHADGNTGRWGGVGGFFDVFLPPQVVLHPLIRGRFLRNLPVLVPSGRLLKEHHVALLSLTTRGPY